jgi:hypothetical protein
MTLRQQIEGRLAGQGFKEVAGTTSMDAVLNGRVSAPGAYVFRASRAGGASVSVTMVHQIAPETYGVVVVAPNLGKAVGDGSDAVESWGEVIQGRLLGWMPNPDGSRPNMSRDFLAQGAGNLLLESRERLGRQRLRQGQYLRVIAGDGERQLQNVHVHSSWV